MALSTIRFNFLEEVVNEFKPDIPLYVCVLTPDDVDVAKSKMVCRKLLLSFHISFHLSTFHQILIAVFSAFSTSLRITVRST